MYYNKKTFTVYCIHSYQKNSLKSSIIAICTGNIRNCLIHKTASIRYIIEKAGYQLQSQLNPIEEAFFARKENIKEKIVMDLKNCIWR